MKKVLIFSLSLFFFGIAASFAASSDDIRVRAEVDKAFLTIGDPVTYSVLVEHPPDVQILSSIPAPASDILEIKKIEDIHTQDKKKITEGKKFILTTFRLGEFILDPVTIQYRKGKQPIQSIQTNKLYLTVKSVAEGEKKEDIRDVKSVVPLLFRLGKWVIGFLIILLLLLSYWAYLILKKRRENAPPPPSPLSPEEEALFHLHELFESDILKRGFVKMYYLRLSEILKIYFEKRYQVLAVELTTSEILRALKPLHLDPALYQKIQYVLESSDLAKFAKWVPSPAETLQINAKTTEVVKESAPHPEKPAGEENPHGV